MPYPVQETVGCDADCPCRSTPPLANPCSCGMYERGSLCPFCEVKGAGGVTAKSSPTKEQDLADFDARMAAAVAALPPVNPPRQHTEGAECIPTKRGGSAITVEQQTTPATSRIERENAGDANSSTAPRPKGRRQKPKAVNKRTPDQVRRGKDREERERRGRAFWNEIGTAVEGVEQDMEEFVASLKRDANGES